MKASEIMTRNPQCVTPEDTLARAAQIMRDEDVGSVPVIETSDSRRLQGVITDRDIAVRHVADNHGNDCTVRHHMSADSVRTVTPDDDVGQVLETMKQHRVRRLPVVEGEDRLVGIIAQADVATEAVEDRRVGDVVGRISEPQ